jgi:L,D-transpeptidase catalytic domain
MGAYHFLIRMGGGGSIVKAVGLLVTIIVGSLFGACAANSAPVSQGSGQVWSFQTPFGIVYGTIPREVVDYPGTHSAGTYRRQHQPTAALLRARRRQAVGMEGYAWSGVSTVAAKREWPDWTPTPDELRRMPYLPRHMAGGPDNPLGARALYLGDTLYRIHGTNEPWKLGGGVSSGCIRMSNDDIVDLYNRAKIGATVIVQR